MDHQAPEPSPDLHRFTAACLAAEGRHAAACGMDPKPYNQLAAEHLDRAVAAYSEGSSQ